MRLILASESPWRRELLERAGVPCEGRAHTIDEHALVESDPVVRARRLALAKARSLVPLVPGGWVLGADQVCHLEGRIFHKPVDADDHLDQLRALAGRTHELVTGVALVGQGVEEVLDERTRITMRALADDELRAYLATGEGGGCAGGYQVEGRGAQLIERVHGDWFNVVGLPVLRVVSLLRTHGWRPWPANE